MEYITNDPTLLISSTDEHIKIENTKLKKIIRDNDSRIFYLERKLNLATEYINYFETEYSREFQQHENICYSCKYTYLYDEIQCDCNIFCNRALCKSCYHSLKKNTIHPNIQICKNSQCIIWTCENINSIHLCKECNQNLCVNHYHEINVDRKNWICMHCCEKAKTEYGYESV